MILRICRVTVAISLMLGGAMMTGHVSAVPSIAVDMSGLANQVLSVALD